MLEKYREKVTHVTLSIDGATAKTHDGIRQREGAFEHVTAAAREYVAAGHRLKISASLNQNNKNEVESLFGAAKLIFGGTIPTPWNRHLALSDEESLALYQQITDLSHKNNIETGTFSSLYTRGGVNFCGILNMHELVFNSRGQLAFCCDTIQEGAVIGSLLEQPFSELIELWLKQSAALQSVRAKQIATGNISAGFDTCAFCNRQLTVG